MSPRNYSSEPDSQPRPIVPGAGTLEERSGDDQVTGEMPSGHEQSNADRILHTRFFNAAGAQPTARQRTPPLVFPGLRYMATLAAPDTVVALSFVVAFMVASVAGESSVLFVLPLVIPSIILGAFDRSWLGQGWRSSAAVNLATVLVLFPLLVIRQSAVRVPYLDTAHGTVYAAVLSTMAVLAGLVSIALFAAWASRQDPESAPMLLLPAAMMVPLLTSATEFARLDTALLVGGMIFAMATGLTLIASMLPPAYTVFVAPVAVAAEVLFVTVVRQDRIFPVGVAEAGMALFATVIIAAIGLVVTLPAMSSWMQRVDVLRIRELRSTG